MSTENKNTIQPWHLPERPRVLMIGNGFNRTFNMKSWKNLIDSVRTRKDLDDGLLGRIPLTMQVVLATDDKVYDSMKEVAEYMRNFHLTPEHTALLEKITEIPTETILTSNYSYELEKVLTGRCGYWARNPYRRYAVPYYSNNAVRFLHRYSHVPAAKSRPVQPGDPGYRNIWHIHGEVDQPRHIIMGHYFYGKMEYEIQTYLSGMPCFICSSYAAVHSYDQADSFGHKCIKCIGIEAVSFAFPVRNVYQTLKTF